MLQKGRAPSVEKSGGGPFNLERYIQISMRIHRLSKSRFTAGLHCERRLWMLVNQSNDRGAPTPAEKRRMQFGAEFGHREIARVG